MTSDKISTSYGQYLNLPGFRFYILRSCLRNFDGQLQISVGGGRAPSRYKYSVNTPLEFKVQHPVNSSHRDSLEEHIRAIPLGRNDAPSSPQNSVPKSGGLAISKVAVEEI